MKITAELKNYMVEHFGVAKDADEPTVKQAVLTAIGDDKLDMDKVKELQTAKATEAEAKVRGMINEALNPINETLAKLAATLEQKSALAPETKADEKVDTGEQTTAEKAFAAAALSDSDGASADHPNIRLKAVVEQFDDTRTAATWDKSPEEHIRKSFGYGRVMTGSESDPLSRGLDMPTQRKQAVAGAWMKLMINKAFQRNGKQVPRSYQMTELDRKLCEWAVHNSDFIGPIEWDDESQEASAWYDGHRKLSTDLHRKTVLDDIGSGGIHAVPVEFDDMAILTPLLTGEIFPYVDRRMVTRRRIEGYAVPNVSMAWSDTEATTIPLFDTDGFISKFETNIHAVTGSIEVGMDFEADSPVGIGALILGEFGKRYLKEMDDVLVTGNGLTQPLGIANTPGVSAIVPEDGPGAPQTVTDYEALLFGVGKEYLAEARQGGRAVFIGTQTSYRRAKGIAVSDTDQRRVFGTDNYEDWKLLDHRYAINDTLTNAQILFACLNRYRLYVRAGYEVRVVTEDWELARKNKRGIIVRARCGGKMELATAMSLISAGQA